MRTRIVLLAVLGVLVLGVAAVAVVVATLDFGRFKGPLAAQVERATGRTLEFEGEVSLRLFPRPSLSVRDVALANAPWGSRPHMLRIGRLDAEVELRPLLFDRALHVSRLVARDVDLLLERDEQGHGNWTMTGAGADPAIVPVQPGGGQPGAVQPGGSDGGEPRAALRVDAMTLENVAVTWRTPGADEPLSVLLREVRMNARADGRMAVDGTAILREQTIGISGDLDLPTGFQAPGGPFVGQIALTLPGTVVKLVGGLGNARAGTGVDLTLSAEAEPVNALDELLDVTLPAARFGLSARLEGDLGGVLRAAELKLRLGRSDLAGAGTLDLSGARPRLAAELESVRLDLVEALPPRADGPPAGAGPDPGAAAAPVAAPAEPRLFGTEPFDLARLRAMDADLSLRVGTLVTPGAQLEQASLRLVLDDGDLALRPYGFTLAGAHVAGDARVNARVSPPAMVVDVAAQQVDIGWLLGRAGLSAPVEAKGDVVLALRGNGDSPRALAATLEGNASLVVGHGTLKGDYIEGLGLAALRAAVPQMQRLAESRLNCAIARFDIARGVATARLIAADAGDLSLVGSGTVNLGTEAVALDLAPRVKVAIGGVAGGVVVPVQVRGTLLAPVITVSGGRAAQRGNPLAALGAIVLDPGASRTNPCGGLGEARPVAPAAPARPAVPGLPDVLRLLPR